jgi:glutamate carboxypeptidase
VDGRDLERVAAQLETELPSFLADLETVVNIDSGTFDTSGVSRVADFLAERYVAQGASVETHPGVEYGDAIVARFTGGRKGKILLVGHTDTVYPLGTVAARPFRIEDGRAFGPGVADMKSGDLSILYAVRALQRLSLDQFETVTVVNNADEEVGSPESRSLIRAEAEKADAVLVLEAGRENGNIVSARKGVADFRLHVTGRSAHAGVNHAQGRSAALELAQLVVALEGMNGTIPGVTLNVGRMEAGERPNVVPDRAFAHLEMRAFQIERLREAIDRAEEIVSRRTVDGTTAELAGSIEHYPMHKSEGTKRLVDLAQEMAGWLGFSVQDAATGGASDGNTAAAAGRPVLDGLGPVGGSAHSPNEYLEISSIVPRTALLAGLITRAADAVAR